MTVNFSYFRHQLTKKRGYTLAVFIVAKTELQDKTPYQVLFELLTLVRDERMLVDHSLLIVSDGGKNRLYGDNYLVDLITNTGTPRITHKLAV